LIAGALPFLSTPIPASFRRQLQKVGAGGDKMAGTEGPSMHAGAPDISQNFAMTELKSCQ
jgi:hypothetical protein